MLIPWTRQSVLFSIGNTTILTYQQNQRIGERCKFWVFPRKYEGLWKSDDDHKKGRLLECLHLLLFLKKNGWWRSKTKRGDPQNAYNYCRFWRILMIRKVEEGWRTFSCWVWQLPQQDFEAPMISRRMAHYVILSLARATTRFWKVMFGEFERHCRRVTKMRFLSGRKNERTPSN